MANIKDETRQNDCRTPKIGNIYEVITIYKN